MTTGSKHRKHCTHPQCLGKYDFEKIAYFARKRFVEGCDTMALLQQARSQREKEEIALVSLLDVSEDIIQNLQLHCQLGDACAATDCRDRLRELIERDLAEMNDNSQPIRSNRAR